MSWLIAWSARFARFGSAEAEAGRGNPYRRGDPAHVTFA